METIISFLADISAYFQMLLNSFIFFLNFIMNVPNYLATIIGVSPSFLVIPIYLCGVILMIKLLSSLSSLFV